MPTVVERPLRHAFVDIDVCVDGDATMPVRFYARIANGVPRVFVDQAHQIVHTHSDSDVAPPFAFCFGLFQTSAPEKLFCVCALCCQKRRKEREREKQIAICGAVLGFIVFCLISAVTKPIAEKGERVRVQVRHLRQKMLRQRKSTK